MPGLNSVQKGNLTAFMKNSHKEVVGETSYLYDEDLWSEFFIKKPEMAPL